jgi:hypothetical protein
MRNIDIVNLQTAAQKRGVELSDFNCRCLLAAKDWLAQDPTNEIAKDVVHHFLDRMAGKPVGFTFKVFLIPYEMTETIEEKELWEAGHA